MSVEENVIAFFQKIWPIENYLREIMGYIIYYVNICLKLTIAIVLQTFLFNLNICILTG